MQHASIQARVRGERESDNDGEALRERDMQQASIQSEGGRKSDRDGEAMSERCTCNTSNQGRVRERQKETMTERQQEKETCNTRVSKEE